MFANGGRIEGDRDSNELMALLDNGYIIPKRTLRELGISPDSILALNALTPKAE
jgi:hypothetical protein